MSDEKKYYCFCGSNCKYETMTKEQILAAIAQATGFNNVDPDAGFITKVKEKNGGNYVTFWVGTQAQYNAIDSKDTNCIYIITDDTTTADLLKTVEQMAAECKAAEISAGEAAAVSVAASTFVDISDKVALAITKKPDGVTGVQVMTKEYRYNPASGVVFFVLYIHYTGSLSKGDLLQFQQTGGYDRSGGMQTICTCDNSAVHVTHHGTKNPLLSITCEEDTSNGMVVVNGWYFCDGAGYVDIGERVALTITEKPAGITDALVMTKEYRYSPTAGVVFFVLYIQCIGSLSKGDVLQFQQAGGYDRSGGMQTICTCDNSAVHVTHHGTKNPLLSITCEEDISNGMVVVNGWYFCDGEV